MDVPQRLRALDLAALVGLDVDRARSRIEAAGGTVRTTTPDGVVTADYRPGRVTLVIVDGAVAEVPRIG